MIDTAMRSPADLERPLLIALFAMSAAVALGTAALDLHVTPER